MTLSRKALQSGLYISIATTFMAAIGMFTTFAERYVIADVLTLESVLVFGVFFGAGILAARQSASSDRGTVLLNGALSAVLIVVVMAVAITLAFQLNASADNLGMDQIFPNISEELIDTLTFEQSQALVGYLILGVIAAVLGGLGALTPRLPARARSIGTNVFFLLVVLGMLQEQIIGIISLFDAIWITIVIAIGYALAVWQNKRELTRRLIIPTAAGAAIGLLIYVLLSIAGASSEALPDLLGTPSPKITGFLFLERSTLTQIVLLVLVNAALSAVGAVLSMTSGPSHRIAVNIVMALLILGVLTSASELTLVAAIIMAIVIAAGQYISQRTADQASEFYEQFNRRERTTSRTMIAVAGLAFVLIIPQLLTGYITNVVDLIGLYVMMGLGLNIVVGYAGLLDLGYVGFFTIGAYTVGVLTTPNVVTCPPPTDNIIVLQQETVLEEPLDAEYTLLRGEPVGVVRGSESAYAASAIPRPDIVEYASFDAAIRGLESGEVLAVVGEQESLAPFVDGTGLYASETFRPSDEVWPARSFSSFEQGAWCNTMPFWMAWPIAVGITGLAGVLLGIPVLRLRGDYLAIVTLGFGEIIRLLALSDLFKPYFGGAQGVVSIPSPVINLSGASDALVNSGIPLITQIGEVIADPIELSQPNQIYYLILAGVLATVFVSSRLSHSRLGRAWRAMREDEDVAQAMGINLVQTKLLAFSIGAAFAGIGGALFGSYLKSIFPNSFTLQVSINVLSLIIIGGMGNIPGVLVGALIIFGLPEALREFEEFRLLMFGALLVSMMLLKPEGILPPSSPRLEEEAEKALAEEGA